MISRYGYHVVITTHNSRTSSRMIKYKVRKGAPKLLSLDHEIQLTKIVKEIIIEKGYRCMAYNVCKDHVHLLLVCEKEKLTEIVKVIKGKSSFLFGKKGLKQKGQPLWSQKFFRASMNEWLLHTLCKRPGAIYGSSYVDNTLVYIENNRKKHGLPKSTEMEKLISEFVMTVDEAYFGGNE